MSLMVDINTRGWRHRRRSQGCLIEGDGPADGPGPVRVAVGSGQRASRGVSLPLLRQLRGKVSTTELALASLQPTEPRFAGWARLVVGTPDWSVPGGAVPV